MEHPWKIYGTQGEQIGTHTHTVQCIYLEGQQPAALRFSSELQMRLSRNATQNEVLTAIGIQL